MELRRYVQIVSTYRWYLILIPVLAGMVGLGVTYLISQKFVGTALVQLIPNEVEPRTVSLRNDQGGEVALLGLSNPTEVLSQPIIRLVSSREVAELVMQDLHLDQPGPPAEGLDGLKQWASGMLGDIWAWLRFGYVLHREGPDAAVEKVRGSLSANLERGSYMMNISGSWRDPQTATQIANSGVRALIVQSQRLASAAASERRKFTEGQLSDARKRMEDARAAVLLYSTQNNALPGDSVRLALTAVDTARAAAQRDDTSYSDTKRRLDVVEEQLSSTPQETVSVQETNGTNPPATTAARTSQPNPTYLSLRDRASTLEQELAAAQQRQDEVVSQALEQNQSAIDDLKRQLTITEQQLAQTPRDTTSTTRTGGADGAAASTSRTQSANSLYLTLRDRVNTLRAQITSAEARKRDVERQAREQNQATVEDARRRLAVVQDQLAVTPQEMVSLQTTEPTGGARSNATSRSSGPNPLYVQLQDRANQLRQELAALETRRTESNAQLQQKTDDLRSLVSVDARLAALNTDLAVASDAYARRFSEWSQAVVDEARPVAPVRVIDLATEPLYPSWPIKILFVGIGAAAGLVAAILLVFTMYNTDLSLRSAADAEAVLDNLRLLAVVPARKASNGGTAAPAPGHARRSGGT